MQLRYVFAAGGLAIAGTLVFFPAGASNNPVPDSACHVQCEDKYEGEAAICGKMEPEATRRKCQDAAFEHYKKCREGCQEILSKCKQKCDDEYADDHKKCDKMEKGPERAKCRQAAGEKHAICYKKCEKKKKGE